MIKSLTRSCVFAAVVVVCFANVLCAGIFITLDPKDLVHNGVGEHEIDVYLAHDGNGLSTFDGVIFSIASAPNATVKTGPVTSDFSGFFFGASVNGTPELVVGAASNMTANTSGTLLATLVFDVSANQDFLLNLNFVELTRSFTPINNEYTGPSSLSVTVSSIPEPASMILLGASLLTVYSRRLKRRARFIG